MTEVPFSELDPQDAAAERRARLSRIIKEIFILPTDDASLYTATGKPKADVLSARIGFTVTSYDRDIAWDTYVKHTGESNSEAAAKLPIPPDVGSTSIVEDESWSVIDLAAVRGPRNHQPIPDGPIYTLNNSTAVSMPRAHALKFLFPDYRVLDANGEEVTGQPDQDIIAVKKGASFTLGHGEIVAKVTELSDDALLLRALRLPGGDALGDHSTREDLESFIITSMTPAADGIKVQAPSADQVQEPEDDDGDDVPLPNLPE